MLRWFFYSNGVWESSCMRRVAGGGGLNLMLQFWLERGRQHDEALLEDESEAASSSWLHVKEVWHNAAAWRHRSEERRHQGGESEQTKLIGLTRILVGQTTKKIHTVNLVVTNGWWKIKVMMCYFLKKHMQVRCNFVHII
jgi:hypothetical protein